jgi:hypothetical protein
LSFAVFSGKDAEIAELGEPEKKDEPRQEEGEKDEEAKGEEKTEEEDKAMSSKDDAGEPAAQPAPKDAKGGSLDDVEHHDARNDDKAEQEVRVTL